MKRIGLSVLLMVVLILSGCQAPQTPAPEQPPVTTAKEAPVVETPTTATVYPLTYTDGEGRTVVIEKEPQKVVSISPSITETLFALEAGSKLVGRTDYCEFPEAALSVASIGTLKEPSIEAIVALEPDLVILSKISDGSVLQKLEELGLTVAVVSAQESFDGLYQIIGDLGLILNVQPTASVMIEDLKARVEKAISAVSGLEKPTVYYAVAFGDSGEYTAGGDTFIHQMIEMAGGDNIAKDISGWTYSLEQLVEKDPQIIIVSDKRDSKTIFTTTENYQQLTAVVNGQVKEVNEDLVQVQGPRLVDGLEALIAAFHPELK